MRCDQQSICQLHYMEIPGLRVTEYFTDKVYGMLNLTVVVRLLSFNYN
jgi:hypothetical protein